MRLSGFCHADRDSVYGWYVLLGFLNFECVYTSFLLSLAHESDARRRMISKSFHHQLKVSERQAVTGPPESMREHVVAASKAMRNGLWRQAHNYIINEKMNAKVCH